MWKSISRTKVLQVPQVSQVCYNEWFMNLPKLGDLGVEGKKVLVRLDLDISEGGDLRLEAALPTLNYLLEKKAKIIIIGHKGRPAATKALAGKPEGINGELSLEKTSKKLSELLSKPIKFIYDIVGQEARDETEKLQEGEVMCLENLRFDSREEANDEGFAKSLAGLGDCYVNDAFASSHREHASIVGIPKYLPRAAGLRLEREIETLGKDFDKPVVVLISGIKNDKVEMAEKLSEIYDTVLVGGRLPEYFGDRALESVQTQTGKLIIGNLIMDKEDISLNTIKRFEIEIEKARTIILAGVLGKYEDSGHMQGTKEVFTAVAKSSAFKIAGGGDTIAALNSLSLSQNFQWISTGGGAMVEFLINKTLPGIEVLQS